MEDENKLEPWPTHKTILDFRVHVIVTTEKIRKHQRRSAIVKVTASIKREVKKSGNLNLDWNDVSCTSRLYPLSGARCHLALENVWNYKEIVFNMEQNLKKKYLISK